MYARAKLQAGPAVGRECGFSIRLARGWKSTRRRFAAIGIFGFDFTEGRSAVLVYLRFFASRHFCFGWGVWVF